MTLSERSVRHPITVAVAVLLVLIGALVALRRLPIQLTPTVDSTIVSVSTRWEGASPSEVEIEIVDEQEEKLQGVTGVTQMTSVSSQGEGRIRLEFSVGADKEEALREVSDRLRQVPSYPDNVDEPVIAASDRENRDYIAWLVLGQEPRPRDAAGLDPDAGFDIRTLQDFVNDRVKPYLERVSGVSEINALGGREREAQVRFDPVRLAQHGLTVTQLVEALNATNVNLTAGFVPDGKSDISVRSLGQFESPDQVSQVVIADTDAGPIRVCDVGEVVETYKEPDSFVRSRGTPVIAINAQREVGSNVIEVMNGIKRAVDEINAPGGPLDLETKRLKLARPLQLKLVYDQTVYIDDAIALVRDNIWQGGLLATVVLLLFLRSIRSVLIIAAAIPISIVGTVIVMILLGRTINVVSLAGIAFSVGMLVDNSIVVLENIYRHLEMGKTPTRAAIDGANEVWGAVLGSTLTTVVVFIPILLIEEEVGQLFRDIAIALCAAVSLSLIVSITVVPAAAALFLRPIRVSERRRSAIGRFFAAIPSTVARFVYWAAGSRLASGAVVLAFSAASIVGSYLLMPPADYLPRGNRNLVFGLLIPPPGYNLDQRLELARRIEEVVEPYWKAAEFPAGSPERAAAEAALPSVPVTPWMRFKRGDSIVPAPVDNYFTVGFPGMMFHGAVAADSTRAGDNEFLFAHATRAERLPGTFAFAFQLPLFNTAGRTGSAVRVDITGDDLDAVTRAATSAFMRFMQIFPGGSVQPDPPNFNVAGPELRVRPDHRALAEAGMTPRDLTAAIHASSDGRIIGDYRKDGRTIDLRVIAQDAVGQSEGTGAGQMGDLASLPISTPTGRVVATGQLATIEPALAPSQINHVDRRRSISLQVTPPPTEALETAVNQINESLTELRQDGSIPAGVQTDVAGSASKLADVRRAMLGDGTSLGLVTSAMFLALIVCYLVMVVLFQSFLLPLVILFSVPLACVGGFAALFAVFLWSMVSPHMPMQSLDVLTMLGFVILIGVVVNNAILIVHQAVNFMAGTAEERPADLAFLGKDAPNVEGTHAKLPPRVAIAESVRTRTRPIMMSSLTSVVGLSPLILVPGAGSELYRGLGAVVAGGLLVSTIFSIFLVPMVMALFWRRRDEVPSAARG